MRVLESVDAARVGACATHAADVDGQKDYLRRIRITGISEFLSGSSGPFDRLASS
jgi:hypothetical protein